MTNDIVCIIFDKHYYSGSKFRGSRFKVRLIKIKRFEDIPACAPTADREACQLARNLTRQVYRLIKNSGFAKDYVLNRQIKETFQVHSSTPALARLDMHSWHDRTECYAIRFYPMGQVSQVWARGSRLENDEHRTVLR